MRREAQPALAQGDRVALSMQPAEYLQRVARDPERDDPGSLVGAARTVDLEPGLRDPLDAASDEDGNALTNPRAAECSVRSQADLSTRQADRVMPGVMFQTGDPTSSGRGGPGWTLRAEFNDRPHQRGTLSMARQADNPNSAGGQWFVCLDDVPEWDGRYTVFGEVAAGMDTVDAIGHVKVRKEVPREEITLQQVLIRQVADEPAVAGGADR